MDHNLRKCLVWSFVVHLAVILIVSFSPHFSFGEKTFRREKITWVTLPKGFENQMGTFRKAVDLPKTTIAESKEKKVPEEKKPEMTFKPKEKEKEKAKEKEKVEGKTKVTEKKKVEKKVEKTEHEKRMERALEGLKRKEKSRPAEVAQVPEGFEEGGVLYGSEEGPFISPDDPEYVVYQAKIRAKIIDAWIPPLSFAGKDIPYRCRISVRIDNEGKVVRAELEEMSGNEAFDQSAMRAIYRASPLDIPPERLKKEAYKEGFLVEFDPELKKSP